MTVVTQIRSSDGMHQRRLTEVITKWLIRLFLCGVVLLADLGDQGRDRLLDVVDLVA